MKIEFVEQIPARAEEKMRKGFIEYETDHGIELNHKRFSFLLTDKSGEVVGVLNGYTVFAEVYIDDLWVDKLHRGKGYGKKLLQKLENHFQGKGFNRVLA